MKWWGWALLGLVIGIAVTMVVRFRSPEVERLKAELAVTAERSRVTDSLLERSKVVSDSVARETVKVWAELAEAAKRAALADSGLVLARHDATVARQALGEARTAADSLPALVIAYKAEARRADAAEGTLAATQVQLMTAGRLLALDSTAIATRDSMLFQVTGDRDRWKATATNALAVVDKMGQQNGSIGARLVGGAETAALAAATVGSCTNGLLSLGCVAGSAATVLRLARGV